MCPRVNGEGCEGQVTSILRLLGGYLTADFISWAGRGMAETTGTFQVDAVQLGEFLDI
jgi:hypothetical protein